MVHTGGVGQVQRARDMIDILFHCIRLIYNALHDISSTKTYFMPAVSLWPSKSVSG